MPSFSKTWSELLASGCSRCKRGELPKRPNNFSRGLERLMDFHLAFYVGVNVMQRVSPDNWLAKCQLIFLNSSDEPHEAVQFQRIISRSYSKDNEQWQKQNADFVLQSSSRAYIATKTKSGSFVNY